MVSNMSSRMLVCNQFSHTYNLMVLAAAVLVLLSSSSLLYVFPHAFRTLSFSIVCEHNTTQHNTVNTTTWSNVKCQKSNFCKFVIEDDDDDGECQEMEMLTRQCARVVCKCVCVGRIGNELVTQLCPRKIKIHVDEIPREKKKHHNHYDAR